MTTEWIIRMPPVGAPRLRLLCLPYAGAGPSVFAGWARRLPSEVEVCAIQMPGRGRRSLETPYSRLFPLIDALSVALKSYLDLPVAIFGYSVGALIGFELARRLIQEERSLPTHLFVAGASAPHIPSPMPLMHHLSDAGLIERVQALGGTPPEVFASPELAALLVPMLRADIAIAETYRPAGIEPIPCALTAFAGADDGDASPHRVAQWRAHTTREFTPHVFPGGHFFLRTSADDVIRVIALATQGAMAT